MSGGKKKSSSKRRKASKYVIPAPSPVKTRSRSSQDSVEVTPPVPVSPLETSSPQAAPSRQEPPPASEAVGLVKALEERLDVRFSQMENAIRSGLSQSSISAMSASAIGGSVATAPPAPAEVSADVVKVEKPKKKKKSRRRSPSPVRSSSSESDSSDSSESSSESDSESDSDSVSSKKKTKKKKGKYDASKFLPEDKKMDSIERLMMANLKMALKLFKKKRNIKGLLQHLVMVAEKAETGMFSSASLCKYDEAVRIAAGEKGLSHFGRIDPTIIFKFLTYDGTVAAEKAKKAVDTGKKSGRGRSGGLFACYAHNYSAEGCKGGCGYLHICSSCGASAHVWADCTSKKQGRARSARK